jgi:hypothetical protein
MQTIKNKTDRISKAVLVVILVALGSTASAQTPPQPVYHPGDMIHVSATFAGPDAAKISSVQMYLSIPQAPTGQAGFMIDIGAGESKRTGPDTFEVSYTIPTNQASGEYRLNQMTVIIDQQAPVRYTYHSPDDFPVKTFKIENPKTLAKPTISSVSVP